ncbi:hypothetical protein ACMFMG_001211 [Clarireedia jacksonii]
MTFLDKFKSLSLPLNSKTSKPNNSKSPQLQSSPHSPNSDRKKALSLSTTNSTTKSSSHSHRSNPKTGVRAAAIDITKENDLREDEQETENDQDGRDFKEYLEKCRKAEEEKEKKRKKMIEMERRRRAVNMSPWAGRM